MPATRPQYAQCAPADHLIQLYTAHARSACDLACRLLYDRAEAEDVVHDVFLTLWRRPTAFDPTRGTARAFVMTVVRNRSRDHLRRRVPREDVDELAERLCDPDAPDVLDEMEAAARGDQLWRLVASLPPAQRDLIRRAYVDGKTHQEIALQTGLPLGTVKSRIRLGLGKLRVALQVEQLPS